MSDFAVVHISADWAHCGGHVGIAHVAVTTAPPAWEATCPACGQTVRKPVSVDTANALIRAGAIDGQLLTLWAAELDAADGITDRPALIDAIEPYVAERADIISELGSIAAFADALQHAIGTATPEQLVAGWFVATTHSPSFPWTVTWYRDCPEADHRLEAFPWVACEIRTLRRAVAR